MSNSFQPAAIPVIGLTGGIASGKSTVSRRVAELGAFVIDADRVGHRVLEPDGEAYAEIVAAFGQSVLDEQGQIVRSRLGAIIFADPLRRAELNKITHPHMARRMAEEIRKIRSRHPAAPGEPRLIVLDAAILFEAGWDTLCDRVWTVSVPAELAIERMRSRDGLDEEQARARLASQLENAEREARAHRVIRNEGSLEELRAQVDRIWAEETGAA